jgi:NAD-dependent dihydropyrimidine dehydrogenase PreA subunit
VIDFSRCGNCLECLNFCLFGVFGTDADERPIVEQPDACRSGCPACSRICPEGAIMFPQHGDPAIAGDPHISPKDLKLDLSQLFRDSDPLQIAEAERRRALEERERLAAKKPSDAPRKGELDDLVDRIDDMDL